MDEKKLRELDANVHLMVFDKKTRAPRYSADIALAWRVLQHMLREWGGCFSTYGDLWGCVFGDGDIEKDGAVDESPPVAICKAAVAFWHEAMTDLAANPVD